MENMPPPVATPAKKPGTNRVSVRVAFPSGLVRSYLDFLLSFVYLLSVLIPFTVIAKTIWTSGILSTNHVDHENKQPLPIFFCLR